jgi:AcrR family transcriptional regulator
MSKSSELTVDGRPPQVSSGVRQQGKARSRQRLLDAARRLFMERGYEAATVRDIAAAAGLSTGAVFASFSDKADLFRQVMDVDGRAEVDAMRAAAAGSGPVEAKLLALLSAASAYQLQQPQLLRAAEGAAWSNGAFDGLKERPGRDEAVSMLVQALQAGVSSGELRTGSDLELIADTLWDAQLANLRRAVCGGARRAELEGRMTRLIRVLLAGQRAG